MHVCVCLGVGAITIIMIIMHKLQNSAAGNQVTCVWRHCLCVCACLSVCVCAAANERQPQIAAVFSLHFPIVSQNGVRQCTSSSPTPSRLRPPACVGACRFVLLTCRICIIEMKTHTQHSRAAARVYGSVCCVGLNQPHHYHYHYQRSGGRSRGRVRGSFICTANPH